MRITESRYVLAVRDLAVSVQYYRDVLGFEVREVGDSGWRFLIKDECCIMAGECPDAMPARELGDHSYFAYMLVDDIDRYFEFVRSQGANILKPLQDEAWGMREFAIQTIDGHRIMFGYDLDNA
ncbi:MAG: VOC family protein [Cyanobacteria bacterium J06648_11]